MIGMQTGTTNGVVDVLYGETLEDLRPPYPRKGSGRWYTLPGWVMLIPEIHADPRKTFGNRVACMMCDLNGAGYYDLMKFGGKKHIERYYIFWIQGRRGNTVYWQPVLE